MSSEITQVNFRMPTALKVELEHAAERSRRTLTAELIARLERSLDSWPMVDLPPNIKLRAKDFPEDLRSQFEVELTSEAERLARSYFPSEYVSLFEMVRAFDVFSLKTPSDKREKIREALQALTNAAVSALPEDRRAELIAAFDQEIGKPKVDDPSSPKDRNNE